MTHVEEFWENTAKLMKCSGCTYHLNSSICVSCADNIRNAYADAVRKDEEEKRKRFRTIEDAVYEELFHQARFIGMSVPCEWYMSCRGGQFCLASSEIKRCKRDNCPKIRKEENI